ncbi:hypothetical protein [Microaceticoccus formicicus]|uniref:hypothetical protein n=1 Tax=Microaceticoccus formicicus TaxID=3118105 RepID=UPI003CD01277|nr:hypothetical protein VZL98_02935 [Peptoniphilaceae bacterium AMB_02]
MLALIKLHIRENMKKNTFIIFAIIGAIVSIAVVTSGSFTVNAQENISKYAQFGYQWRFLILISSFAAVSLSMAVISKHREGNTMDLLKLHGLSPRNQYLSRILGNVLITLFMAIILTIGMTVNILAKGIEVNVLNYLGSISIYILASVGVAIYVTLFSMLFAPAITALFGILISAVGFLRGILLISVGNMGGVFGKIMTVLIKLAPPIDNFGELARDLFFNEFSNWNMFLNCLISLWILVGITYFVVMVVSRHEV